MARASPACTWPGVHELTAAGAVSGLVNLTSFRLGPASSRAGHSAGTDARALLRGLAALQGLRELRLPSVDVNDERWGVLAEMPVLEVLEVGEVGEVGASRSGAASACSAVTSVTCSGMAFSTAARLPQLLPALVQLQVGSSAGGGQQQQAGDGSLTLAVMRMRWQEQQEGQQAPTRVGQQAGTRWQQVVMLAQWLDKASLLQPLWLCGWLWLGWLCCKAREMT